MAVKENAVGLRAMVGVTAGAVTVKVTGTVIEEVPVALRIMLPR